MSTDKMSDMIDPNYLKAKDLFKTSASQVAHDLGNALELHRQVEMSNAKLCELIMVHLMRSMEDTRGKRHMCVVCHQVPVDVTAGYDTCPGCVKKV